MCGPLKMYGPLLSRWSKSSSPRLKAELKRVITKVWQEMDEDKELCKRLMLFIPKRLQAVIDVDGRQINKKDYG